jgi:hypothetical protein
MMKNFRYGILISLFLIFGVLIAGCSDQSPPVTPVTTTAVPVKYVAGDIIAMTSAPTDQALYVILNYDRSTDQYTRQLLYKNADGSWGHFVNNESQKVERTLVETVYKVKISHVQISVIPVITPTVYATVTTALSGNAPSISGISPASGANNLALSMTVTGDNFRSGATVKLTRAGYPAIYATGVSVSSSTEIDCTITFSNAEKGRYNLEVTNPDGRSATREGAFTLGDAPPIIGGVSPSQGALNETLSMQINGQNFKTGVKVSFMKSSTEIICTSPVSTDSTKILCTLDLKKSNGAEVGDWNVIVLNIDGQQNGTWNQKFHVTN